MIKVAVTERDFRRPEFLDANPEDYEFREDGKIVRKDRWERGIKRIVSIVGLNNREFEIDEVIERVRLLHQTPVRINQSVIEALEWALKFITEEYNDPAYWANEIDKRDYLDMAIERLASAKKDLDDE